MDAATPFTVTADPVAPDHARLGLRGRVTVASANELKQAIGALVVRAAGVTIDCSEVEYLDVSAVQLLMGLRHELVRCGRTGALTGVSQALAADFRLLGLDPAFFATPTETPTPPCCSDSAVAIGEGEVLPP